MKPTRNLWPYGVIAVFVLFFGAMATVVIIASTHRDSLVSANYYEQELKYQTQINAAANADKSGATMHLDTANEKLIVTVPVTQLKQNLTGKVSFYRANAPELDRECAFAPGADGTQPFNTAQLAAGPWRVRVSWNAGGQDYFLEQKITL